MTILSPQSPDITSKHQKTSFGKKLQKGIQNACASIVLGLGIQGCENPAIQQAHVIQKLSQNKQPKYPSELSSNLSTAYGQMFSELRAGQFLFVDSDGNIFEGVQNFPIFWDNFSNEDKQKYRDELRANLSKKYNLAFTEHNSRLISMHNILRHYPNNPTMIEIVSQNMQQKVPQDEQNRNHKEYLEQNFVNITGDKTIDAFLQKNIIGLASLESGFDNNAQSHVGAIGILQLMPSMIKNKTVNPKGYSIAEVKNNFPKQVELAKNLFRADYIFLKRYIKPVAEQYFAGSEVDAKNFLIAPIIMNAYNTGGPNIKQGMEDFLNHFQSHDDIKKYLGNKHMGRLDMDIYLAYTRFNKENPKTPNYKNDSATYVIKIMGITEVVK